MKKYKIKYQEKGQIKSKIVSENDLEKQIVSKNILQIKEPFLNINQKIRVDNKIMNQLFYELRLMLKANINIGDALEILIKKSKNQKVVKFLETINYSLSNSKPIIKELERFKIDSIIKSFLHISQNSANLNLNIEAISNLLNESMKIKKSFFKAISYPVLLIISFIISIFIIFLVLIPNFKSIFSQFQSNLPMSTQILLNMEYIFKEYFVLMIFLLLSLIFLIIYFYNYNKFFNFFIDKLLLTNIPVISKIYLNYELYKLFLVVDIMQKSKYEFHKAFQTSKVLLKNKYLLDKIYRIDNLLENGKTISYSFGQAQIFDDTILNLLSTGEVSNSLNLIISDIKMVYKSRFNDSVNFIILLIQPISIVFMGCLILFIVFAIFTPIWDMGSMIR